ncbi:MAG: hypothetical protein VST69_02500 [Nitrospirota bacterium]|nr:hypothetical protein [Nitrospirota bacterium]
MMCYIKVFIILAFISVSLACSNEGSTVNMKEEKVPTIIQKTFDITIQPQINSLNKVKALEGKLKKIEAERLKSMKEFGQ